MLTHRTVTAVDSLILFCSKRLEQISF